MENEFSRKIKRLRLERRMTLEQVADIVGVGKSTVRKWETGMIANMRRDKIDLLAKALGVAPSYLMGWEDVNETVNTEVLIVSDEEKLLLDLFRLVPEGQQKLVLQMIRAALNTKE